MMMNDENERRERVRRAFEAVDTRDRLDDIERDWTRRQDQYMVHGRHGARRLPSKADAIISGTVLTVIGLALMCCAVAMENPTAPTLIGLTFISAGVFGGKWELRKYYAYYDAEANFYHQRQRLLMELERKGRENKQVSSPQD